MRLYKNLFERIISLENLFSAWNTFRRDKQNKADVLEFEWNLEENIFQLYHELKNRTYKHGPYEGFYVQDPKQRHIHKALVHDRILHHAIFSVINPIFEKTFIPTSFSCRIGYGTHKGVEILNNIARKVSKNNTNSCFALKCDIKKFFDSVNHATLISILEKRIKDSDAMWLLREIIKSYDTSNSRERERERERVTEGDANRAKGIPIGNLTSQLFANIYMNELDQFIRHVLKIKYYVRYTDDFVIISENRNYLEELLLPISEFLNNKLSLSLHPKKITIRSLHQGVDYLGYVVFPKHLLIRTKTKKRILVKIQKRIEEYKISKISKTTLDQSIQSYLGVLSYANAYKLRVKILNELWFFQR